MATDDRTDRGRDVGESGAPKLGPDEVAAGVTTEQFEARHPEDPASRPGWDAHVKDFFDREVFPGEKVRKATDAMKEK
ncbi:hypothetical protein [Enterovirga rhinocerotis]|uniref:Uncharacterized protein n=1 Tax=Enterovirga rhinocerotis TaxID=1339210 RepID=A0A4R7BY76_9HYPH|nr:hypothetical protein [Enterovirga rhinocerotis]TDR89695.1 hypothetical protein EV668_2530 [Enterovirga rhinocerotis]